MSEHDFVGLAEALDLLGISRPTLYRWLREGRLEGYRVGRQWRFSRRGLEEFVRRGEPAEADALARDVAEALDWLRRRREERA